MTGREKRESGGEAPPGPQVLRSLEGATGLSQRLRNFLFRRISACPCFLPPPTCTPLTYAMFVWVRFGEGECLSSYVKEGEKIQEYSQTRCTLRRGMHTTACMAMVDDGLPLQSNFFVELGTML